MVTDEILCSCFLLALLWTCWIYMCFGWINVFQSIIVPMLFRAQIVPYLVMGALHFGFYVLLIGPFVFNSVLIFWISKVSQEISCPGTLTNHFFKGSRFLLAENNIWKIQPCWWGDSLPLGCQWCEAFLVGNTQKYMVHSNRQRNDEFILILSIRNF